MKFLHESRQMFKNLWKDSVLSFMRYLNISADALCYFKLSEVHITLIMIKNTDHSLHSWVTHRVCSYRENMPTKILNMTRTSSCNSNAAAPLQKPTSKETTAERKIERKSSSSTPAFSPHPKKDAPLL